MFKPKESKEFPGWYEIPGFSKNCANRKGQILTKKTKNFTNGGKAGRYLKVAAYRDGRDKSSLYYVHDLVCRAFHGSPTKGHICAHLDNDRSNNKPSNLKWITQSENIKQTYIDKLRFPTKKYVSNESLNFFKIWLHGNNVSLEEFGFEYVSVNSSNIDIVGYNRETKELEITFKSGSTYIYEDVSVQRFYNLVNAESVGKYFHKNIRNNYIYRRVN